MAKTSAMGGVTKVTVELTVEIGLPHQLLMATSKLAIGSIASSRAFRPFITT